VGCAALAMAATNISSGEPEEPPPGPISTELQTVADITFTAEEAGLETDDDCPVFEEGAFATPRPSQEKRAAPTRRQSSTQLEPAICRFTIQDFIPSAVEPNPYLRQSIGKFLPWLHDCGEKTCPFTKPPYDVRRQSLERGMPLPNFDLSPGNHIRVDKRAFTHPMTVRVRLEQLGYDSGLWGGARRVCGPGGGPLLSACLRIANFYRGLRGKYWTT
jgi:hypothetical protein